MTDLAVEPKPKHRFTPANARMFAAKAVEAKRRNRDEREQLAKIAFERSNDHPKDEPNYCDVRLMRVRKQLNRIDRMMMEEDDPVRLDRLASAQIRLSEQERILAGRALPGSLRPIQPRGRRNGQSLPSPVEPEPPSPAQP